MLEVDKELEPTLTAPPMISDAPIAAPSPLRRAMNALALGRSIFRLRPFDTSTADGRAMERYRRVALTAAASVMAKGVQYVGLFLSVSLTVGYLGTERYGLWMALNAIIAMMTFADLGLGFGLMNAVSAAHGKDDVDAARRSIWSVTAVLGLIAAATIALFFVAYPWIPWTSLLKHDAQSPQTLAEAGPAMAALIICFALGLPLQLVSRVQMAYQEGFETNLWSAFGSILSLGMLLTAIRLKAGLVWLMLGVTAAPLIANLINWTVFLTMRRPVLRPGRGCVTLVDSWSLLRTGFVFFIIQMSIAVGYQSDNLVIANMLGLEDVTLYSVTFKLFLFVPMLLSFITQPLWPAYGEAIARGDVPWIRKTLKRSFMIGLAINVPPSILLAFFGDHLIHLWVGPQVTPTFALRLGFALWAIINGVLAPLSMFLSGINVVKFQIFTAVGMAVFNLAISIILTRNFGVVGCIYGTVSAQILFMLLPALVFVPKLVRRLDATHPAPVVPAPKATATAA